MESKNPAFWAGHTFSVVTGAAFVISAALNALSFWLTWKLNYFLIASPADVVMSGFILVATFALLAGLIAGGFWAAGAVSRLFKEEEARRAQVEAELDAVINQSVELMQERLLKAGLPAEEVETISSAQRMGRKQQLKMKHETRKITSSLRYSAGAMAMLAAATLSTSMLELLPNMGKPLAQLSRPWWYATGLQVAPEYTEFNGKCANAPVAWLGSSTAILECSDRVRVIHKLDDLVTVQRYAR